MTYNVVSGTLKLKHYSINQSCLSISWHYALEDLFAIIIYRTNIAELSRQTSYNA